MTCRYDRDAGEYLIDGKPCRTDDYGDPTKHCTMPRCSHHIGEGELTCARCIGRVRNLIRRVVDLSALMLPVAVAAGVNSEAANLAGPFADYETFSARRMIDKRWISSHIPEHNQLRALVNLVADDDEQHPYGVLTRWEFMLREDYRTPRNGATSIAAAASYLGRVLHRVAQDDEQDFALLARELRACRDHLERAANTARIPERGAPCPACIEQSEDGKGPRLVRDYGHWCDGEDCERIHHEDDSDDWWTCPRVKAHAWSHEDYRKWVDDWAADAIQA